MCPMQSAGSEFDDERAVPSFLWDRGITNGELRSILADTEHPQRISLLRVLLREARPDDVWTLVTPAVILQDWDDISPGLGRRRAFWDWLLRAWRELGLIQ